MVGKRQLIIREEEVRKLEKELEKLALLPEKVLAISGGQ
jgi:hypothetical protein